MIVLADGNAYTLAHEHKNGWNAEAFKERYSEVMERYDYIVGDWGYSQLRLRGFYEDGNPRATKETAITGLVDYLNEYCNFGCAYFVLTKTDVRAVPPGTPDLMEEAEPPDAASVPAASDETDAQTAETAASAAGSNGILMRWPLKERPGGPVRVPGAAAVARAAQEAERRSQQAAQAGARTSGGAGPDKRSSGTANAAGQADSRSGGRPGQSARGSRPQGASDRQGGGTPAKPAGQWRQQPSENERVPDSSRSPDAMGQRPDSAKGGSRWPGKNRRRNRSGGKPNRPDDGGSPGKPGGE